MKIKNLIIVFIILLFSYWVNNIIKRCDIGKNLKEIGTENLDCKKIPYKTPIEDFRKLNETLIIGTSFNILGQLTDYAYLNESQKTPDGTLISFNLKTNKLTEIKIKNFPSDVPFHPHGMDLFQGKYIFIVNHGFSAIKSQERILLLEITNKENLTIEYVKSFILPEQQFGTSNSIADVSLDQFYVTTTFPFRMPLNAKDNTLWTRMKNQYGNLFSLVFNVKLTGAFFYNNGQLSLIKETKGIFNNGIIYDDERKMLYVAQTAEKRFLIFDTSKDFKNPKLLKIVQGNYAYDNLYFDKNNKKIYGAIIGSLLHHQNAIDSYAKYGDLNHIKEMYGGFEEIDYNNEDKVKIIHLSKNKLFGISTGMYVGDKQILSASMEGGILICQNQNE